MWAISTANGKNIPLDPSPSVRGNIIRTSSTENGQIVFHARVVRNEADDHKLYVSHFVTCPDAKTFRKPR